MKTDELLKNYCIGLTGGIAVGKSTVASVIRQEGFEVIDADALSRLAVAPNTPGLKAVNALFGNEVLHADGSLDRDKLRTHVFQDPQKRQSLEDILHPEIRKLFIKTLTEAGLLAKPHYFFYEAALLFETGFYRQLRAVWTVYCRGDVQLTRLMARTQLDRREALAIIASQMDAREKCRLSQAVIDSEKSLADLTQDIANLLAPYRNRG